MIADTKRKDPRGRKPTAERTKIMQALAGLVPLNLARFPNSALVVEKKYRSTISSISAALKTDLLTRMLPNGKVLVMRVVYDEKPKSTKQ